MPVVEAQWFVALGCSSPCKLVQYTSVLSGTLLPECGGERCLSVSFTGEVLAEYGQRSWPPQQLWNLMRVPVLSAGEA